MNDNVRKLIDWWILRGEKQKDPFLKFFIYYLCFDAWITAESGKDSDAAKKRWFKNNDNCLRDKFSEARDARMKNWLTALKNNCPIRDMRPGQQNKTVSLSDLSDVEEVVEVLYQIRCNLFYGSKSPNDSRDANLVYWGSMILEQWIKWAFCKC